MLCFILPWPRIPSTRAAARATRAAIAPLARPAATGEGLVGLLEILPPGPVHPGDTLVIPWTGCGAAAADGARD
jgi:hypothetical protein